MSFADLIERHRDGTLRPEGKDQAMVRAALRKGTCSVCGRQALCAYDYRVDRLFCSDECRDRAELYATTYMWAKQMVKSCAEIAQGLRKLAEQLHDTHYADQSQLEADEALLIDAAERF